jgi:hypothetical protein
MGKQTIFINPDPNFNRDPLYKGSALAKDYSELKNFVNQFYISGKIEQFFSEEKENQRKKLIKDIIGFGDGFNHIRAGYYFQKTIERYLKEEKKPVYKFHFWHWLVYVLIRIAGPFYNRNIYSKLWKVKKHLWVFENYKMEKLEKLYSKYHKYFSQFYEKNDLYKKISDQNHLVKIVEGKNLS